MLNKGAVVGSEKQVLLSILTGIWWADSPSKIFKVDYKIESLTLNRP